MDARSVRSWAGGAIRLLAALVALSAPPALLAAVVGNPLPALPIDWSRVVESIQAGLVPSSVWVNVLTVVAWLAWTVLLGMLTIEVVAVVRNRPSVPAIPIWIRRAAQILVAAEVAFAGHGQQSLAAPTPGPPFVAATAPMDDSGALPAEAAVDGRLVTVGEGDSWGGFAADVLGDGSLGPQLRTANVGCDVGAGETVTESSAFVEPGWRLLIPAHLDGAPPGVQLPAAEGAADAKVGSTIGVDTEEQDPGWKLLVPGAAPNEAAPAVSDERVVVKRGDTLWDLADEHLDDAYRWPEIYEENRGEPQPDGGALTDPDLIQPGWVLDLPSGADADDAAAVHPAERDAVADAEEDQVPPSSVEAPAADDEAGAAEASAASNDTRDPETGAEDVSMPAVETEPAPTVAPTHPEPTEHVRPTDDAQADDIALVPIAAAGTVAAGLVLTLDRIRRARLRRRQPHHRIPLSTGAAATAEQRLRSHADPDADRLLNLALRELSSHYADHRPGPPVVLASHSPAEVAVHLDVAATASPDGWERHDDDHTWSRQRPARLDTLESHLGTPSRFPALVTLGTLPGGRVALLNLAHAGCVHLDADEEAARRLMEAWALELATTPRADALDVVTVAIDDLPDGLERLRKLSGADELRQVLSQPHSNGQTNLPRTVILAADLPADVSVLLRTASDLRGDLVAVVSGLEPRNGNWSVFLEGSGRARLDPADITFDLLDLGSEAAPMTAKLIEQALHDPEQLVQFPDEDKPETIHLDGAGPEPEPDIAEASTEEPTTEVRVLGPVEIVGTVEPFRTNKTMELIVYLALHRSGAGADTLLEALWPGQEPRRARLYTEASRARKSLGTASDGTPHFPDAELGRYGLADSVALDHERFTVAVTAARRDRTNAIDHLQRALMLVRGVPLSATASEYAWATNELYSLAQEVVDAAHDLARLCLEAERYDDAIWAAERGLLADPLAEVLVRDLMEAAAATGNTARVHAAMTRLRRQVAEDADANDADDWLHPETLSLFNTLVGKPAAVSSAGSVGGRPGVSSF